MEVFEWNRSIDGTHQRINHSVTYLGHRLRRGHGALHPARGVGRAAVDGWVDDGGQHRRRGRLERRRPLPHRCRRGRQPQPQAQAQALPMPPPLLLLLLRWLLHPACACRKCGGGQGMQVSQIRRAQWCVLKMGTPTDAPSPAQPIGARSRRSIGASRVHQMKLRGAPSTRMHAPRFNQNAQSARRRPVPRGVGQIGTSPDVRPMRLLFLGFVCEASALKERRGRPSNLDPPAIC